MSKTTTLPKRKVALSQKNQIDERGDRSTSRASQTSENISDGASNPDVCPLDDLRVSLKVRHQLGHLLSERAACSKAESEAKARAREINMEILDILISNELTQTKIEHPEGFIAKMREGKTSSISKDALLKLGVSAATILRATKETVYSTVEIRFKKESDDV